MNTRPMQPPQPSVSQPGSNLNPLLLGELSEPAVSHASNITRAVVASMLGVVMIAIVLAIILPSNSKNKPSSTLAQQTSPSPTVTYAQLQKQTQPNQPTARRQNPVKQNPVKQNPVKQNPVQLAQPAPTQQQVRTEQQALETVAAFAQEIVNYGDFTESDPDDPSTVVSLLNSVEQQLQQPQYHAYTLRLAKTVNQAQSSKIGLIYLIASGTHGKNLQLIAGGPNPHEELIIRNEGKTVLQTVNIKVQKITKQQIEYRQSIAQVRTLEEVYVTVVQFTVTDGLDGSFTGMSTLTNTFVSVSTLAKTVQSSLPRYTIRPIQTASQARSSKIGVVYIVAAGTHGKDLQMIAGGPKPHQEVVVMNHAEPVYQVLTR
jgi:hypothetical protein